MRKSSRAIIIKDGKMLTMFRRKINGEEIKEYYVIPGGGLEDNETLEQNVIRELKEEMSVDIKILGYLGNMQDEKNSQYYFHCEITNGEPKLGGEELDRMTKENYYEPRWIELSEINNINILGTQFIEKAKNREYINR